MSDPVTEIKNESRLIQQKIYNLEQKINTFESHHEVLNKILELESKINRIEILLHDKLTHLCSTTDTTLEYMGRVKGELDAMKEKAVGTPSF